MRLSPTVAIALASAGSAALSVAATLYFLKAGPTAQSGQARRSAAARAPAERKQYAQEIIDEQQARTRAFLKEEGMEKLRAATVAVVGVGGVGSWVATMLVRSGIGKVRIIDFDQVSLSSLNRHACATLDDVGTSKVECLANYLRRVAPWVEVEPINSLWRKEGGEALVADVSFVVDCIDNIDTKVDLLAHCYTHKIPVISSMGAGAKADPTRIMVGDVSTTFEDRLSRATRLRLRARGINGGIPVVYSTEKPGKDKAQLLELEDSQVEAGNVGDFSVLQDFRVRILPVLGPLPAMFGLAIATHLLCWIGGYRSVFDPVQGGYSFAAKNRTQLYEAMLSSIIGQLTRLKLQERGTCVSNDEIEYLIEEVWRGKTIKGQYSRQKLSLWDPAGPRNIHNMVPMVSEDQKRHEQLVFREGKSVQEVWGEDICNEVEQRMELDRWYGNFRV